MNFLVTTCRVPMGTRPIHCWPLTWLLREFGVSAMSPRIKAKTRREVAAEFGVTYGAIREWNVGNVPTKSKSKICRMKKCRARLAAEQAAARPPRKYSLWELWEIVRDKWKKLRREIHPDISGKDHSLFATMSHIYDTIMVRFKAKGIGC